MRRPPHATIGCRAQSIAGRPKSTAVAGGKSHRVIYGLSMCATLLSRVYFPAQLHTLDISFVAHMTPASRETRELARSKIRALRKRRDLAHSESFLSEGPVI